MPTAASARAGSRPTSPPIAAGADLVAGFVRADRAEHAQLPIAVIQRGRLESRYEWLLAELLARLDPEAHDPWPRHRIASGASLARHPRRLSPGRRAERRSPPARTALWHERSTWSVAGCAIASPRRWWSPAGSTAAPRAAWPRPSGNAHSMPDLACDPALEPAADLLRRGALARRAAAPAPARRLAGRRALGGVAPAQPIRSRAAPWP